jgi:Ubiquitin-Binding Zinc Finger
MSRLFAPPQRWRDWKTVLPLYDGRQCPDCAATVIGRHARQEHRDWHVARTEYDSELAQALAVIGRHAGVKVAFADPRDAPDGRWDDEYEDEETDEYVERMGRKLA